MILGNFLKQPDEYKDYDIDYVPWLSSTDDDDFILEAEVKEIVCLDDPNDMVLICKELQHTKNLVKVWMESGTSGYVYKLTVLIKTNLGRIDESELIFAIEDI